MSAVVFDSDSNVDALVSQMILRPSEEDHDLEIYFRKFANDLTLTDEPINVQSTSNNDDDGGHTPTVPTWLPTSLSMVQGDYYPDSIKSNSKSTPQVTFADSQCTKTALHSFSCDPIAFSPATAHDAFRITFNADCSSNLDVKSNLSSEPISNISAFQSTETEIAASQHHTDDTSTKCSTEYAIESGPGFHHLMPSLSYGDNFPIADVSSCPKNCSDCSQNNIEQWLQPNVTDLFNDSANFITPVLFPADNMQMTAMDQSLRTRWINWNASNPIGSIIPTTTPNSLFHSWASMINPSPAAAPFIKEENLGHVPSTASNGSFSSSSASSSFAVTTIPSDQSLPPIDRKHIDSLPMQGNVQYDCPTNPDSFIGTSNSFKSSHNQRSFFKNHRSFMCGQNFAGNANRIDLRINVEKCFDQLRQLHSETDQVETEHLNRCTTRNAYTLSPAASQLEFLIHELLLQYNRVYSLITYLHNSSGVYSSDPFNRALVLLRSWYSAIQKLQTLTVRSSIRKQPYISTISPDNNGNNEIEGSQGVPIDEQIVSRLVDQLTRFTRQVRTTLWSTCTLLRCMHSARFS